MPRWTRCWVGWAPCAISHVGAASWVLRRCAPPRCSTHMLTMHHAPAPCACLPMPCRGRAQAVHPVWLPVSQGGRGAAARNDRWAGSADLGAACPRFPALPCHHIPGLCSTTLPALLTFTHETSVCPLQSRSPPAARRWTSCWAAASRPKRWVVRAGGRRGMWVQALLLPFRPLCCCCWQTQTLLLHPHACRSPRCLGSGAPARRSCATRCASPPRLAGRTEVGAGGVYNSDAACQRGNCKTARGGQG